MSDPRNSEGTIPSCSRPWPGITDFPFSKICKEFGAGLVFSEMLSVEALVREHKRTKGMLHHRPRRTARRVPDLRVKARSPWPKPPGIVSLGEVDFIDINMGCPVPKILKSGAGSALLRDIGLAREIMAAVVEASPVPVTVKIRLGWDAKNIVAAGPGPGRRSGRHRGRDRACQDQGAGVLGPRGLEHDQGRERTRRHPGHRERRRALGRRTRNA